jgi:hypothetical protein
LVSSQGTRSNRCSVAVGINNLPAAIWRDDATPSLEVALAPGASGEDLFVLETRKKALRVLKIVIVPTFECEGVSFSTG